MINNALYKGILFLLVQLQVIRKLISSPPTSYKIYRRKNKDTGRTDYANLGFARGVRHKTRHDIHGVSSKSFGSKTNDLPLSSSIL